MENILSADRISFRYRSSSIVQELSLAIGKGEMVSIVGPNGSGKSTLLRLLTRLLRPESGTVYLDGEEIARMRTKQVARQMTMLPQVQEHAVDMSVRDLVSQGRHPHLSWFQERGREDEAIIDWALATTDLTELQHRALHTLSGGERQRAWIAMAVAQDPRTLLLDEPTTYLDMAHQLEVMELLQHLNRDKGITIIMVLHDLNQAARYSDRIVALKDGAIVRQGTPVEVFDPDFFEQVFSVKARVHVDDGRPVCSPYALAFPKTYA